MNELELYRESVFEEIRHVDEEGREFWYARELAKMLKYMEWRKFLGVIEKAKMACEGSSNKVIDHFVGSAKMVFKAKNSGDKTLTKRKIKNQFHKVYINIFSINDSEDRKNSVVFEKVIKFKSFCVFLPYFPARKNGWL